MHSSAAVLNAGYWCGCVCCATGADKYQLVLWHAEDVHVLLVFCAHDVHVWSVT